jgi:DnaK suppressor protein
MTVDGDRFQATQEMLTRERAAVLQRIQAITHDALTFELESDGIPPSGHEGEQALIRMLNNRLADIDGALSRVDDGTYGICAECSTEIPPRRLEALPFATLCVSCQSVADKRLRRMAVR